MPDTENAVCMYIMYVYTHVCMYAHACRTPKTQRKATTVGGDGKNKKNIAPVPRDL